MNSYYHSEYCSYYLFNYSKSLRFNFVTFRLLINRCEFATQPQCHASFDRILPGMVFALVCADARTQAEEVSWSRWRCNCKFVSSSVRFWNQGNWQVETPLCTITFWQWLCIFHHLESNILWNWACPQSLIPKTWPISIEESIQTQIHKR